MENKIEKVAQDQLAKEKEEKLVFNFVNRNIDGEIPNLMAIKLIKHYKDTVGHDREDDTPNKPGKSKCVWFSFKEIEAIYEKVKNTPKGDGIRIYFARYPNEPEFERVRTRQGDENHKKKRTLVIITTKEIDGISSQDDINEEEIKAAFKKDYDPKELAAYNHGELCPQNCKGTTKIP